MAKLNKSRQNQIVLPLRQNGITSRQNRNLLTAEGGIRRLFFRRFEYKEIRLFLFKNHGIEMRNDESNSMVYKEDSDRIILLM